MGTSDQGDTGRQGTTDARPSVDGGGGDVSRLSRIWAGGLGALMLVTLPLWIPRWNRPDAFPRIPWLDLFPWDDGAGSLFAAVIDGAALVLILISILALVWDGRRRKPWWVVALSLLVLISGDQHRLQPWAYQSVLYGMLFAGLSGSMSRRWIMAVAISVYFYSAAGKLDFQFAHTVGMQMVQGMARPLGGIGEPTAVRLALLLPAAELVVALLLMVPVTRRWGGWAAVAMHVTLIGLLGPWSLNHSWGVLTWNLLLGTQAAVLFALPQPTGSLEPAGADETPPLFRSLLIRGMVVASLVMPLTERWGLWDHWPSWALYSPHNSRADVQIHRSAINRLPLPAQDYLSDQDGDGWNDLDVERWSLDECGVPIYPQQRYQMALALRLADRGQLQQAVRVKAKGISDRWNGRRSEAFLIGQRELSDAMDAFWMTGR